MNMLGGARLTGSKPLTRLLKITKIEKFELCSKVNLSSTDKYINEVIGKFNKSAKKRKGINLRVSDYFSEDLSEKNNVSESVISKFRSKECSNRLKISSNYQHNEEIESLLKEGRAAEAYDKIFESVGKGIIPPLSNLRKICSLASKQGYPHIIRSVQELVKEYFPNVAVENEFYEIYLCEAMFRHGDHIEALNLLNSLIGKHENTKKLKDSATYIMRLIPDTSEDVCKAAIDVARKFIHLKDEFKPAFALWKVLVASTNFNFQMIAKELSEEFQSLLAEEETRLSFIIEEAFQTKNITFLQHLIEYFLKLESKELLQKAVSSLLLLHCMFQDLRRADETVKFAHEENLIIEARSMTMYMNLLRNKTHKGQTE